eukprot:5541025-Amphidinium_carterae.1
MYMFQTINALLLRSTTIRRLSFECCKLAPLLSFVWELRLQWFVLHPPRLQLRQQAVLKVVRVMRRSHSFWWRWLTCQVHSQLLATKTHDGLRSLIFKGPFNTSMPAEQDIRYMPSSILRSLTLGCSRLSVGCNGV